MAEDRIDIEQMVVRCTIGVGKAERARPQPVHIDISMWADLSVAAGTDNVADSVDYFSVARAVRKIAAETRRHTVEALATDIARSVCSHAGVTRARVRVRKPQAIWDAAFAGVEIERTPHDFDPAG